MTKNNKPIIHRYNLASAISRFATRFFDLLFVVSVNVGFYFLIFQLETFESFPIWKFSLILFLLSISLFLYFIILPFLTSGYTIFSKIFKIRIFSISLNIIKTKKWIKKLNFKFFIELLKRESLTLLTYVVICILLGATAFIFPSETKDYLKSLSSSLQISQNESNPVTILFSTLFSLSALLDLCLIFNIALCNRRRSLMDQISNTVVIKMVDTISSSEPSMTLNLKNKSKKVNYNLPGEIDFDNLDNEV